MRPQLLFGGLLVAAMGAGFYFLELPFVYFWSLPFGIAGVIMLIIGFFVSESQGPVQPPEGHRFCPFCSTPVRIGVKRCPHCNGLQGEVQWASEIEGAVLSRKTKAVVTFRGHPLVRSAHPTTLEVTTEDYLTPKGDCIVGVGASSGCAQLNDQLKERLRRKGSRVTIRMFVGPYAFEVRAEGDPRLELSNPRDIVIRKSDYVSDRTLAVHADAAARDVPRDIVRQLRDPGTLGRLEIEVA